MSADADDAGGREVAEPRAWRNRGATASFSSPRAAGATNRTSEKRSLAAGFDVRLVKPIAIDELSQLLATRAVTATTMLQMTSFTSTMARASAALPPRQILVVDVGGTHVKVALTGRAKRWKLPSG